MVYALSVYMISVLYKKKKKKKEEKEEITALFTAVKNFETEKKERGRERVINHPTN